MKKFLRMSKTDLTGRLKNVIEQAQKTPIMVTHHNEDAAIILSIKHYEKLIAKKDDKPVAKKVSKKSKKG